MLHMCNTSSNCDLFGHLKLEILGKVICSNLNMIYWGLSKVKIESKVIETRVMLGTLELR